MQGLPYKFIIDLSKISLQLDNNVLTLSIITQAVQTSEINAVHRQTQNKIELVHGEMIAEIQKQYKELWESKVIQAQKREREIKDKEQALKLARENELRANQQQNSSNNAQPIEQKPVQSPSLFPNVVSAFRPQIVTTAPSVRPGMGGSILNRSINFRSDSLSPNPSFSTSTASLSTGANIFGGSNPSQPASLFTDNKTSENSRTTNRRGKTSNLRLG